MKHLRLTRKADADLAEIWDYIADDSLRAADKMLDRLEKAFWMIVDFAEMGVACPEIAKNMRRHVVGSYCIYYQSDSQGVLIVRILHGALDIESQSFDD